MMSLLFLISLVSVVALPLNQLTLKSHLQSMDFADPGAVGKLKDYTQSMIDQGHADIKKYTDIRNEANQVEISKRATRDAAKEKLDRATAHHSQMVTEEKAATVVEKEKQTIRIQKEKAQAAQGVVLDKAKETNRTEQLRLNKERALFEKVKGLLNGVKAPGRRLLDAESDIAPILAMLSAGSNADPAQVEEANKLLDELIAEGEKERAAVVTDLNNQQDAFDVADDEMNVAINEHVLAMGALAAAKSRTQSAQQALDLAKYEHGVALGAWNDALADLQKKQATLDSEKTRIEAEQLDLERIMELLNKL